MTDGGIVASGIRSTLPFADITEWGLPEKEFYSSEELLPETYWNSGGVSIHGARSKEGLTQKQLAAMITAAQHHVSEMENGKRPFGKETAKKLAAAPNIDYRVFCGTTLKICELCRRGPYGFR